GRMPGDEWQRFANLRLLYGFMFTHPGTKLLFMGAEIAQYEEWDFEKSLDWELLDFLPHAGLKNYVKALNGFYKNTPALYEKAFGSEGFEWIAHDDAQQSIITYMRKGHGTKNDVVVVCNFTPTAQKNYRIGLPQSGKIKETFNSDAIEFGGSGVKNKKAVPITEQCWNDRDFSAEITIPPLGTVVFQFEK
ncbi:MAG: alpha amylase C-terminal domain-containing protein, partial [Marinirhabdus sp.]